jgi:hypothetical protein
MVKNQLKKNLSVKGKIQLNIKSTFFKRFHFSFSFGSMEYTKDFDTYKVLIQVWECHQFYKKVGDLNFASVFNLCAYHKKTHFYS